MRSRLYPLLLVLLVGFSAVPAWAGEPVYWSYVSFPPHIVVQEHGKLSGSLIALQRELERELAEYEHVAVEAPLSRALLGATRGDRYCMAGVFRRPEREKVLLFSSPSRITGPFVAVTLRGGLDAWKNEEGHVSLRELLADHTLITGRIADMSYGPEVDRIFDKCADEENIINMYELGTLERPLRLLVSGRVAYMVLSPDQAWYVIRTQGLEEALELVPLVEARTWQTGHTACTRSHWGRAVMPRLEAALQRLRKNGRLKAICRKDVPPSMLADFDAAWDQIMGPYMEH
ncbi:conserved hypothetical protein [Paucidesulfovibrio gracilis DSM 16080]|uniref:Solute-binding protein family 3/N-terminal domain-containing protein n=1 Tax=Paucidesulfovibrio gracilis DSM 16080 TaxID=1121449 RepID=A0A1T4XEH6_9BACT|nr:transporter substrate-binding domain-containing protein [Paucidesulfovibrio gracilis]SKA87869.1 conserved hypothetical protein [Paucidesulfovibrio gracilis DSM 16080]